MARIVVQTDDARETLLDERTVSSVQLESKQSAAQLLERIAWAIDDADARIAAQRAKRQTRKRLTRRRGAVTPIASGVGRSFD
jgi:hypothetical protein